MRESFPLRKAEREKSDKMEKMSALLDSLRRLEEETEAAADGLIWRVRRHIMIYAIIECRSKKIK